MSVQFDEQDNNVDPEAQVRKLQDLVQKLERQNQLLRGKQSRDGSKRISIPAEKDKDDTVINTKDAEIPLDYISLIDINHLVNEEEDEWLYKSPTKLSPSDKSQSPYKWMRHEFDHPSPEVETARRSLLYKLEEVCYRASPALHVHGDYDTSTFSRPKPRYNDNDVSSTFSRPKPRNNDNVDSSTFSRPKPRYNDNDDSSNFSRLKPRYNDNDDSPNLSRIKPRYNDNDDSLNFSRLKPSSLENDEVEQSYLKKPYRTLSSGSSDNLDSSDPFEKKKLSGSCELNGSMYKLTEIARMQEESLRQSFTTPSRKAQQNRSRRLHGDKKDVTQIDASNIQKPETMDMKVAWSDNSLDNLSSADNSPSSSPHGSNLHIDNKDDLHRRSLPNIARQTPSPSQYNDEVDHSSANEQNSNNSPNHLSSPYNTGTITRARPSSPYKNGNYENANYGSNSNGLKSSTNFVNQHDNSPTRTASPVRTGIPTPRRSGIPRKGTGLPVPKKSVIPSSTSYQGRLVNNFNNDESWKDGCY